MRNLNSLKRAQPIALLVVLGACGQDDGNGAAPDHLTPAHWYFAVKAYNSSGAESVFSSSVNKLIE